MGKVMQMCDKAWRIALTAVLAVSLSPAVPREAEAAVAPGSAAQAQLAAADVWDGSIDTSWYSPSAIEFEISKPAQLAGLAAIVNGTATVNGSTTKIAQSDFAGKTIRLAADMQLNSYSASTKDNNQELWIPIGNRPVIGTHTGNNGRQPLFSDPNYFRGTFDGRGHVVSNIYVCTDGVENEWAITDYGGYQGLFGALGAGAVVENLGVSGGFVSGRVAGAIASLGAPASTPAADVPKILNCFSSATVEGDGSSSRGSGGIFGGEQGSEGDNGTCYIANCFNLGSVKGKNGNAGAPLGGIAGRGSVRVFSCYSTGTVAASASGERASLVGSLLSGGAVADSYGLSGTAGALYYDDTSDDSDELLPVTDGLLARVAMASLVSDGKLSAAFVAPKAAFSGAGSMAAKLFWQDGWTNPADISASAQVTGADQPQGFTGYAIEPPVSVAYAGAQLKAGSDYFVTYANNVNAGTASYTVHFIGRYGGAKDGSFTIASGNLATCKVYGAVAQWAYGTGEGNKVVPDIAVLDGTRLLTAGKDYDLAFEDNWLEEGASSRTARLIVSSHAGSSYAGEQVREFAIVAASDTLEGKGTNASPYLIGSREDMQLFAHRVNAQPVTAGTGADVLEGVYKLTADIDMAGGADVPDVDLIGDYVGSYDEGYRTKAFGGTLDGGGHSLNLDFSYSSGSVGLFPTNVEDSTVAVRDLHLTGKLKTNATAAALFPNVYGNVELTGVENSVDIEAYRAYGFIGSTWPRGNSITMEDCVNEGAITATREAAGLVGELGANTSAGCAFMVSGCANYGPVTARQGDTGYGGQWAAGILGKVNQYAYSVEALDIENTANYGAVDADGTAAGIVAYVGDSNKGLGSSVTPTHSIVACCNQGQVTAGKVAGGLVGAVYDSNKVTVSNAYNAGLVEGGSVAGGIVAAAALGSAWYVNLNSVYNAGAVSVSSEGGDAGALMGFAGAGSIYSPAGAELTVADAYYLEGSAAGAVGTLQEEQRIGLYPNPAAQLAGNPVAKTAAEMKATGTEGMAALLGEGFADDAAGDNGGFPVLYWQLGQPRIDISTATVSLIPDVEYTGLSVEPAVTVTFDGAMLRQGADFAVSVDGDATEVQSGIPITITGIGRYFGTLEGTTFNIVKADISNFAIDPIPVQWGSATDPAEPAVTMRNRSGTVVRLSSGFTVSYSGNTGDEGVVPTVAIAAEDGNERYRGTKTASFAVRSLPDAFAGGSGTSDDPFQIATYQQLELFAKRVNGGAAAYAAYRSAHARLAADITLPADIELDPIGSRTPTFVNAFPFIEYYTFGGTFDGAGHSIELNYNGTTDYSVFGGLDGATVRNLTVAGQCTTTGTTADRTIVGGTFAGYLNGKATFVNCTNRASVTATAIAGGGFVTMVGDGADLTFSHCVNAGPVTGEAPDGAGVNFVGGLLGYAFTMGFDGDVSVLFEECVNRGAVSSHDGASAGGILGGANYDYDSTSSFDALKIAFDGAGNEAAVSAFDGAGGLAGVVTGVESLRFENAYNTGAVSISNPDGATGEVAGGIASTIAINHATSPSPDVALVNVYNAGSVTCSGEGDAADPLIGGLIGGLGQYDASSVTFDNVYYSIDKTAAAIAADQTGVDWSEFISPEVDKTMRAESFAAALGSAFAAADADENGGFPVLASSKVDIAGCYACFYYPAERMPADPTTYTATYTGKAISPEVVVRPQQDSSDALVNGADYVVFYDDNVSAGTATATIVGIGTYTGSTTLTYTISSIGSLQDCAIAAVAPQRYTGGYVKPAPVVTGTVDGVQRTLVSGVDYTVSYANNLNPGKAGLIVKGTGGWTGSRFVFFTIWKPMLVVRVRSAAGKTTEAKAYTQEELEALASAGSPVSAMYWTDGSPGSWKVSTAKTYVTLDRLFADAGVPWGAGASVSYEATDNPDKASTISYSDLYNRYFFPKATPYSVDLATEARRTPPVLAIEERSSIIGSNYTENAADAEAYNVREATRDNEPRVITGITKAEARAKSARGARLIKKLETITVVLPANPMSVSRTGAAAKMTYGKAKTFAAGSLFKVSNAKGAVKCMRHAGNSRISVAANGAVKVPATMPVGTYPLTVRVHAAGNSIYAARTADVKFNVVVGKAANTLAVKALVPSVSKKKVKKKAQKLAVGKVVQVTGARGPVSYAKVAKGSNKKLKVAANGALTVPKGMKKGTYQVVVKVSAAGNGNYAPTAKTVTVKVKVK